MPRWWADGTDWLDALPRLLADQCAQWDLVSDGPALHGSNAIVLPVVRKGFALMLRMTPPTPEFTKEVEALTFWDGRGTVRLLDHNDATGAMLLERLCTTATLTDTPLGEAIPVIARLMRRLAVPVGALAHTHLPSTADLAAARCREVPAQWDRLGRPFPRAVLDRALSAGATLSATACGDTAAVAVNGDLHCDQVLAGTREPWLAVDPVLLRGDIEYDLARILWTRIDEMADDAEILFHLDTVVREARLDSGRAWRWAYFRTVDYWLWGLDNGLTTDPERCRRLVAALGSRAEERPPGE